MTLEGCYGPRLSRVVSFPQVVTVHEKQHSQISVIFVTASVANLSNTYEKPLSSGLYAHFNI